MKPAQFNIGLPCMHSTSCCSIVYANTYHLTMDDIHMQMKKKAIEYASPRRTGNKQQEHEQQTTKCGEQTSDEHLTHFKSHLCFWCVCVSARTHVFVSVTLMMFLWFLLYVRYRNCYDGYMTLGATIQPRICRTTTTIATTKTVAKKKNNICSKSTWLWSTKIYSEKRLFGVSEYMRK